MSIEQKNSSSLENKKASILFFHNTLPEYRIGWFQNLSKNANVEFVFTNEELNKKDYGFDIDYERSKELKSYYLPEGKNGFKQLKKIMEGIDRYDFVELPPIDSLKEAIYSYYIVKMCKRRGVKIGYFWEKWEAPKEFQPIKRKIKNIILRIVPKIIYMNSDVFFAVGRKSKSYFLANGVHDKKIKIIPDVSETVKCEYFNIREKHHISQSKKIIMFLGRMLPQKGAKGLIEAFNLLEKDVKEKYHLLIAGDGEDLDACKKLAEQLKLENITFAGSVNPSQRENYFKQCDIFVYPVTYESGWVDVWGLTINEAVQHGKIVIATDAVGSAYELITDGVNGYRVKPDSVEALKDAILKVDKNDMTESAKKEDAVLMKKFNYENMAREYLEIVDEVIDK